MRVKYAYLDEQFGNVDDYLGELRELVKSGEFTLGPWVDKFEKKFANYLGVKHVISTNTGTDALILALKGVGVGHGDEVITVANTFYATAGAVVAAGARPVFVDCDECYQIDVNKIEKAITPKTKAILPVHWAGCPPEMETILEIANKHKIPVVEDACPAVGAKIGSKFAGTFGKTAGFSMHPLKPLNVWGDGGMMVTNDDAIAAHLRLYRNHGMIDRDHIEIWGINNRLQPIQAMVGMRVLDQVDQSNDLRIRNAKLLDDSLKDLQEFVKIPPRKSGVKEVYQLYMILAKNRDGLVKFLNENQVEARVHYPIPLHLQNAAKALGYKAGDFPVAEQQAKEVVTLPAHQYVTPEQIAFVIDRIRAFYTK